MTNPLDHLVSRMTHSEDFDQICALIGKEFPGLETLSKKMYACLSVAGTIARDHPDVEYNAPVVTTLALELFRASPDPDPDPEEGPTFLRSFADPSEP